MTLSRLQRFILTDLLNHRLERSPRRQLNSFYKRRAAPKDIESVITKSLERLIDKELLVGYGRRTPHKWFIDEVRLTAAGRRLARRLLGEQQQFSFPSPKKKKVL